MRSDITAGPGRLADPEASRAVLVGASRFEHGDLDDLPAVANNLARFAELLTDPDIWGLSPENCVVIGQEELSRPDAGRFVLDAIRDAAEAASDTLLVYYAGHGLLDEEDSLYLAVPGSDPDLLYTAVDYKWIRETLRFSKRVERKVVVLDCCYAGRAAAGGMARAQSAANRAASEGSYLLAAAAPTVKAWAQPGEQFTAFTGELVATLANGVPGGAPTLDMETVYRCVHAALAAKSRPLPEQYSRAAGQRITIARNRAHRWEHPVLPPVISDLLHAQIRAAEAFPYRLAGIRVGGLSATYVRQAVSSANPTSPEDSTYSDSDPQARPSHEKTTTLDRSPQPVNEILSQHDNVIVTGGPGLGKSTMTLQLARDLAELLLSPSDAAPSTGYRLIPLRIGATALSDGTGPFKELVVKAASTQLGRILDRRLPDRLLDTAPANTRWLLIVDGIDEIVDRVQRREVLSELGARIATAGSDIRLLITSRPLPKGELDLLPQASIGRYELERFDDAKLKAFAQRWFAGAQPENGDAARFLEQVGTPRLRELVRIPLLAAIAAIVYAPDRPLPTNRYELYEQYLAQLASARARDAAKQWKQLTVRLGPLSPADTARISNLFENRLAVARHAAQTAVSGSGDLVESALAWADEHGGRIAGPPSVWRDLAANALEATSLFVREADRLRFIHHSFAEHLAAAETAARLPERFSPNDQLWSNTIRDAVEETDGENGLAFTALIHFAHTHVDCDELFTWLESGPRTVRGLVARLIAAGVPTSDARTASFRTLLEETARSETLNPPRDWKPSDVWTAASHFSDDSIGLSLTRITADQSNSSQVRIRAAKALMTRDNVRAVDVLRELIDDPYIDARDRIDAAELLGDLGGSYVNEAADVLRAVFASTGVGPLTRSDAADSLAALGPAFTEQAAAMYRTLLALPGASAWDREIVADDLADLGPEYQAEGSAVLLELLRTPSYDLSALRWAAQDLVDLDERYRAEAVKVLASKLTDVDIEISEKRSVARTLATIDPEQIVTTIGLLCDIAAQSAVTAKDRTSIAELIAELDPAATAHSAAILDPILTATMVDNDDRIEASRVLASLGPSYVSAAAATLMSVAEQPGTNVSERVDAAKNIALLGDEHTSTAITLLHRVIQCADIRIRDRIRAIEAWAAIAPDHTPEIARTLRTILGLPGLEPSHTEAVAETLGDLGPAYVDETLAVLCQTIGSPTVDMTDRLNIAKDLAEWSDCVGNVEATLNSILDTPGLEASDRVKAAAVLGGLGPPQATRAAEHLRSIAAALGVDFDDRIDAAKALGALSPSYLSEAAEAIRAIAANRTVDTSIRRLALKALAELSPQLLDEIIAALG